MEYTSPVLILLYGRTSHESRMMGQMPRLERLIRLRQRRSIQCVSDKSVAAYVWLIGLSGSQGRRLNIR